MAGGSKINFRMTGFRREKERNTSVYPTRFVFAVGKVRKSRTRVSKVRAKETEDEKRKRNG